MLKQMFTTAPILAQFDSERETVVEADSSGYAIGGILSQYDDQGLLRPCAYFSRKNIPAECNYEIHDKELLAIISCLKEWESELSSVKKFRVITDHKNLRYFTSIRRLSEQQMRWADILGRYNLTLEYRPGKLALRPDALSRREQDMPDSDDERLKFRERQLFDPKIFEGGLPIYAACVTATQRIVDRPTNNPPQEEPLGQGIETLWNQGLSEDKDHDRIRAAVSEGLPQLPRELNLKLSIAECAIDGIGRLTYRDRLWVPGYEPLRTTIMQQTHDSVLTGHPGKNTMYAILARRFYWPSMSTDVKWFVQNCDHCGANTVWRNRRQGLLKPLPIPEQKWRDIAFDFIEKLPPSEGCSNLLVVTDRLSKGVILMPCKDISSETVAKALTQSLIGYRGIPASIVSDRGTQLTEGVMKHLCRLMGIQQRKSTAFHPQTDGQTERMNATIEEYLRNFCSRMQDNWATLLPMAQLAINSRDASSTGISPFFLDHGYNVEPFALAEDIPEDSRNRSPKEKAQQIARKLKDALDVAASELAAAQEQMEQYANRKTDPAPKYQVGDKVWLNLRNIRTDRPNKKLDVKHAKYTIIECIGSHAYQLDTPGSVHDVFHTSLLRPAASNPFPSQATDNYQPPAELVDDHGTDEYRVDDIIKERTVHRGRGHRKQYLVKWTGYRQPTWEPADFMEDTAALERWLGHTNGKEGGNVKGRTL
jgi:hypothetical protein